ncbi:EAL domain-containing protein [Rhodoferax sp. BAB1]|uniref:EAL domain-containing response regulator n=1 Tax=Rhodoferax sp. BAB1 TaxID=2741720 RepID=UPI0015760636|nr:EAL domain-containing protein [Rhodoferax sp. BAB1]QKO21838.1 EAL domain-containing protein [Rhodoferax sp. BAB1]
MNAINVQVVFRDEPAPAETLTEPWRILVVDDDHEVHQATRFALDKLQVSDRPLELLHAHSSAEALRMLAVEPDIAVVLLDVVMETPTAGLDIIARIRGELGLNCTRIILRTGQPGYAPEIETIRKYDINDYKSKSELTQAKLYAALSVALRTYAQLCQEARARANLEKIIDSGQRLKAYAGADTPGAADLLLMLAAYFGAAPDGFIADQQSGPRSLTLLAVAGRYPQEAVGSPPSAHAGPDLLALIERCLEERRCLGMEGGTALHLRSGATGDLVAWLHLTPQQTQTVDLRMLDVFCAHMAVEWQNQQLLEKLRRAAYTDTLTGLHNRAALVEKLEACRGDADCIARTSLALIDIDQFSGINDMFGHVYGDRLLQLAAQRLRKALPPPCELARVSNDTFAVWAPEAVVQPDLLRRHFSQPFVFDDIEHTVSVSIGVVHLQEALGITGADLLKEAWIALKRAKMNGHGQDAWYTTSSARETREHTRLLHALRTAFQRERLFLMFQPQVALDSGRILGVEALLRWKADDGRFIPPDRFLPIAESSGLIVDLGAWVLRSALRALQKIEVQGHPGLRMSVNVSAHQFSHPRFLADLQDALAQERVPAGQLELEITESVAIVGTDKVEDLLKRIRQLGITIAIDDFGTGYSSLAYLDRLPVDRIKIDRSFVQVLNTQTRGARIAELVIPLGQQLGLTVLAEGVETREQAEFLRSLGCHEAQGYWYAKPMPLEELLPWLQAHGGGPGPEGA